MAKKLLEIDFKWAGIINDATRQVTDWFNDISWLDIWKESWVAQINKRLENDTTTSMALRPLVFTKFDGKIIAWLETKEIWYNSTWTTWVSLTTNATNWDNNDIWYSNISRLSYLCF